MKKRVWYDENEQVYEPTIKELENKYKPEEEDKPKEEIDVEDIIF